MKKLLEEFITIVKKKFSRKAIGIILVIFMVSLITAAMYYKPFSGNDTLPDSNPLKAVSIGAIAPSGSTNPEDASEMLGKILGALIKEAGNIGTPVSEEISDASTSTDSGTPVSKEMSSTHSSSYSSGLNEKIVYIQNLLASRALEANEYEMDNQEQKYLAIERLKKEAKNGREKRLIERLAYTLKRVNEGKVSQYDLVNHVGKKHVITGYDYSRIDGSKVYAWADPRKLY